MLIFHKGHTDTIQVYSVTVMTHVKALQAGHSSQGTSEPITPAVSVAGINSVEWAEPRHDIRGEKVFELPTLRGDRTVHHGHGYQ